MPQITYPVRGIGVMARGWLASNLTASDGSDIASAYTEAEPEPGLAISDQSTSISVPVCNLAQDEDLELAVVAAGFPGALAYRVAGETDSQYRGINEAWQTTGGGVARYNDGSYNFSLFAAALDKRTQTVMVASPHSSEGNVALTWSPEARTWTEAGTITTSTVDQFGLHFFEDTRTWVAFEVSTSGISSAWHSTDGGVTWALYAENIYDNQPAAVGPTTTATDAHGNLVLCVSNNGASTQETSLYRSESDRGASFTEYHQSSNTYSSAQIAGFSDGSILLVYVDDVTDDSVKAKVLPDAYTDPDDVTAVSIAGANSASVADATYSVAVMIDHQDTAHVFWVDKTDPELVRYAASTDGGVTFTETIQAVMQNTNDGASRNIDRLRVVPTAGEALLLHRASTVDAAATEDSLWYTLLGGWSNAELGASPTAGARRLRRSFATETGGGANVGAWFGQWAEPGEVGFTLTSGGTPSESMTSTGWQIDTDGTMNGHYGTTFTLTDDKAVFYWECSCDEGGDQTGQDVIVYVNRRDGVDETEIEVRYDTAGFRLHDVKAGADIETTAADMTIPMQFLLVFDGVEKVGLLYKRPGDTLWIDAGSDASLNTAASASTTSTLRFGHFAVTDSISTWGNKGYAERMAVHSGLAAGVVSTKLRWGARLTGVSWPVRDVGDSLARARLAVTGGPHHLGETYQIPRAGPYRVEHLFPITEPSPDVEWRGTDETEAIFTVDLAGFDTRPGPSWALLLHVAGAGFRQAKLYGLDDATETETELATLDLATGFTGLSYLVSGNMVRPASGAVGSRYVLPGELVGGYVVSAAGVAVRIIGNSGGYWGTGDYQPLVLELADDSLTGGSTIDIVWPEGVLVLPLAATVLYRYWRVALQAGNTPEGALSCGSLWLGSLLVPGRQWGRGTLHELMPRIEARDNAAGVRRQLQTGRARRRLTVGWPDGHDYSRVRPHQGQGYLAASASTAPLVTYDDVRHQVEELFQVTEGGRLPVVAVLQSIGETAETITDRSLFLSGWLEGNASSEAVQGTEGESEVNRTQNISVVERN